MYKLNEGIWYYIVSKSGAELGEWEYILLTVGFALAAMLVGYLLGSINSAVILSKILYRDDIRRHGSGNAGMTNMLRTFGLSAAALTLLGDLIKTALAIVAGSILGGFSYLGGISVGGLYCDLPLNYIAGFFAVIGHILPIYHGFKGGKGVLCTATVALILTPIEFAILLLIFVGMVAFTKYVSLGSVTVAVLYPVVVNAYVKLVFNSTPHFILSLCLIILAIFIVWCHRENLVRISNRTERKISIGGKKKKEENEEHK
jgi:glycerol-3-phosphate acyltransferase PlsY